MKVRLTGLPGEVVGATERLAEVFDVVEVSEPYPCRGASRQVRVYVEARGGAQGRGRREHLHRDDCPAALGVLGVLFARRPRQAAEVGYEPTEQGAWVDWDALERSWLSSTERAAVWVVRGVAAAERRGGWAPGLQRALVDAVGAAQ